MGTVQVCSVTASPIPLDGGGNSGGVVVLVKKYLPRCTDGGGNSGGVVA